jgi:hypothetical protein
MSSGMSLSLKARFYAIDTPLVTATVVATISQKAKTIALAGLKTMLDSSRDYTLYGKLSVRSGFFSDSEVFSFTLVESCRD